MQSDGEFQREIRSIRAEEKTPWGEISKALDDVDDQRISHCKDDIDSLLVFVRKLSCGA